MAEIALSNVSKSYGRSHRAVRDLDLQVLPGELLVLVGPSGCGKTTTLRLIAGLETPDRGEIRIDGRVVNRLPPGRRNIAMVFQEFSLYPHFTARRNMAYALKLRRVPRREIRQRIEWAAELTGISALLDRKPGALSGGERQRVALAVALVRKPAAHLLDEPLSNLDALTRRRLRTEIRAVHRRSRDTILHVTHDQEEAMSLGDRIAVMERGRIRQIDTPRMLYERPNDRFVAGFIGRLPMNFIEGFLQTDQDRLVFRDGHGVELAPPESLRPVLGKPRSRNVVYGVRPEHLSVMDGSNVPGTTLEAVVRSVESLGDHQDLYVTTRGGADLIAQTPGGARIPEPGETIRLACDIDRACLFEPGEPGRRISDTDH